MSEDGLTNLEDDTPEPPAPPAPPVEAPVEPPAAPEPPDEPDAVELSGQKYVPVGTLIEERKQRQAYQKEAAKVAELEAYARDSKPYVEFLKANPGLINQRQAPAPAAPTTEAPDPQAEQLAKTLDLYTPEGKPDLVRAGTIQKMVMATAEQVAQRTIAPIQQESDQTRSARNFQIALTVKDAQGNSPSQQALTQIWRTMDAKQTADPHVASILALTALGLDSVSRKQAPVPPSQAPIVSEGQGGGPRRPALSALEQNIARDRGITESKWAENTKGFTPGRAHQLED